MTALLLGAALVVATGAVATLAPADPRLGLVGLAFALAASALVADPLPSPAVLAVRISAALLAVAVIRAASHAIARSARGSGWSSGVVARPLDDRHGSPATHPGWPAAIALAAGGAVAGLAIGSQLAATAARGATAALRAAAAVGGAAAVSAPPAGTGPGALFEPATLSLGLAGLILALATGPALLGPIGLRRALAAVLLTAGLELGRLGLGGPPGELEEVVLAATLVAVAGATAVVVAFEARAGASSPEPDPGPAGG